MEASREELEFKAALGQLFADAPRTSLTKVEKHGKEVGVNLGRSKVSSWRSGTAPAETEALATLVRYLQDRAGKPLEPYALEPLRERAFARRNENRGGRPRKAKARSSGLGTPVTELHDPAAFDIPPVIESPAVSSETLTPYVERAHDRRLRDLLTSRGSCVVVVAGDPSTGKTRAVWEALRTLPSQWRVWRPSTPEEALAEVEEPLSLSSHTVIFLDDAHTYLHTPDERTGERLAVALRALTNDVGRTPIVIVAAIWKTFRDELVSEPDGVLDPHAKARRFLSGQLVDVPDAFGDDDVVGADSSGDPRMAEAVAKAPDGRITQYLAGTLELEQRYRTANELSRELIHVAMDTYRLGLGPMLTFAVLRQAVPGYVSAACPVDDESVRGALVSLGKPRRGTPGPLSLVPHGSESRYRLADHLEQIGWVERRTEPVGPALWQVLSDHATPNDLMVLAEAAVQRQLAMLGVGCYVRAFRAGRTDAAERIGWTFDLLDRTDEAIEWFGRAAELDVAGAAGQVISLLLRHGRLDEACSVAARTPAREQDDRIGYDLVAAGRIDDAMVWLQRSFAAGRTSVATYAARRLHERGHHAAAIDWFERSEQIGDHDVILGAKLFVATKRRQDLLRVMRTVDTSRLRDAALHIRELFGTATAVVWIKSHRTLSRGDVAGIISTIHEAVGDELRARRYRDRAAEAGDPYAMWRVARDHQQNGQLENALQWWMRIGESGHGSLRPVLALFDELGREEEGTAWLRARQTAGHGWVTVRIMAWRLLKTGKLTEAIEECRKLPGPYDAAELLRSAGHPAEAAPFYRQALTTGDEGTRRTRGEVLDRAGFTNDAITWYQQNYWHKQAVELLVRQGQADVAWRWLTKCADSGDLRALQALGEMHEKEGRIDDAISAHRRAAAAGDHGAVWRLARLLAEQGRVEDARAAYLRLTEAGDVEALHGALTTSGDWSLADRAKHQGLVPGGRIAPPWRLDAEFTLRVLEER